MRIAHVLPYDRRQPGGVQTHTDSLSRVLMEHGHTSQIFVPAHPRRFAVGGTRADFVPDPRDLLNLRRFLQRPHDILHVQEPLLPLLGPLAMLHPSDAKLVVTLHSAEAVARNFYKLTRPLVQRLLNRADAVICASEVSLRYAEPVLPPDPHVIFPCFDAQPFFDVTPQPQPNTILFVGRDEPRKDLPSLIQALDQLPEAQLVVAGPVTERTLALADSRTTFLGQVPHDRIPELMSTATCAAFPATGGEALGLVLVEAQAAGLPAAASDIDGYRIASMDGRAALLTPPGNVDALADNLRRLLSEPDLRQRIVAAGKESAQRFDAPTVAQQHIALYETLLSS